MNKKPKKMMIAINENLHRELKRDALNKHVKLYTIIEDALGWYLDNLRASKQGGPDKFEQE